MNWNALNPHNNSFEIAFESLCIQLFEHYLRRNYKDELVDFFAAAGSGGDGGVEAFASTASGKHFGLQAKYYRSAMNAGQIRSIKNSILTAKSNYPHLTDYIICIPKRVNALKSIGENKKTKNDEQAKIEQLENQIAHKHADLKITWWFENILQDQIQFPDCQHIEAYWFGKSFLTFQSLDQKFTDQQKHAWLKLRYVPDLNAQGIIADHYSDLSHSEEAKDMLSVKLEELSKKLAQTEILIDQYVKTIDPEDKLLVEFGEIKSSFSKYNRHIADIRAANKNDQPIRLDISSEKNLWEVKLTLDRERPTNIQLPIVEKLSKALSDIHKIHVTQYLGALGDHLNRKILMFFGSPGTGKTQGLAYTTKTHLAKELPAVIIPAKGTPCESWTTVLASALELPMRNAEEILTALEALATIKLRQQALTNPSAKAYCFALICIDGLEEDLGKRHLWYNRINDAEGLTEQFPRLRFIFSARDYFDNHDLLSEQAPFEKINLPFDGDVSVREVAPDYFDHFNIRNVNDEVMMRIENLYALKLFCERYANSDLAAKLDVQTDLRTLLAKKIDALNEEFKEKSERRFSPMSKPLTEVLQVIAEQFFTQIQINRRPLLSAIQEQVDGLHYVELEHILDFLAQHGLLTASSYSADDIFENEEIVFFVPYQSIIEHLITEKIYKQILEEKMDHIPNIIIKGIVRPRHDRYVDQETPFPNETILELLLKRVFLKTGKLVGIDGFLSQGLQKGLIVKLQMNVLASATSELGPKFEDIVESWIHAGKGFQQSAYLHLIRPSVKTGGYFNTKWLHHKILAIPTVYERDKFLWVDKRNRQKAETFGLESAILPIDQYDTSLYPFDKFDDEPIIYAWCLSSPNRRFKKEIRSSLMNWAHLNITEWIKLLSEMVRQNDTQILEDLSSVTLGLSHKHHDPANVKMLAEWALNNIFKDQPCFYSSRIQEGFRAIVERAFDKGLVDGTLAIRARPAHYASNPLLPVDEQVIKSSNAEVYPIISDLSWYVIDDAYQPFLENGFPNLERNGRPTQDSDFLKQYADKFGLKKLGPKQWAVAAALHFIRHKFGFHDKSGSLTHLPSQGEKGEVMHFAEKYVWQSVYFLQAHLSQNLKLIRQEHFLETFSSIVHLPNPAESPLHSFDEYDDFSSFDEPTWIVPEHLVHTVTSKATIIEEINGNWKIALEKWLHYIDEAGRKWTHLYFNLKLNDKNNRIYGRLTARLVLIRKEQLNTITEILEDNPKSLYFVRSLGSMVAYPDAESYSNPSDIVANPFISEDNSNTYIEINHEEYEIEHTVVRVSQSNLNDEVFHYIPSRLIRKIAGIVELKGKRLRNDLHQTIGFTVLKTDGKTGDEQQMTSVLTEVVNPAIEKAGFEMFWFVEVFKRTTLETEKADFFLRRTRKFAVYNHYDGFRVIPIWDKDSSN